MQAWLILAAILAGLLAPQAHPFVFLVRYFLMGMLLLSFIQVRFRWRIFQRHLLWVLLLNVLTPLLAFALLSPVAPTVALALLVIGLAPTAAVAPVIAGFLQARVEVVTASVLVTNPLLALIIALVLPLVIPTSQPVGVAELLQAVSVVVLLPLAGALLIQRLWPAGALFLARLRPVAFYLFLGNVFLAAAKAGHFVRENQDLLATLAWIGLGVAVFCVILFKLGEKLAPPGLSIEYSLALGRKNTMFAIWVALTFLQPVVAFGPMFYILAQNAYNSWQIARKDRLRKQC